MWRRGFSVFFSVLWVVGCASGPLKEAREVKELLPPRGISAERIGVALAGGGSKAAPYAMGVLAAIVDSSEKGLERVDAVSSVSGGGYAAFFLYSKLLVRDGLPEAERPPVQAFFADCLPHVYRDVLPKPYNGDPPLCQERQEQNGQYRFQQFVRCRQDVFEQDCNQQLDWGDGEEYATAITTTAGLAAASTVAAIPNFVARSLFDWPVNLSPTRSSYKEGIGTAYGLYPRTGRALTKTQDIATTCNEENFVNCEQSSGLVRLKRDDILDFKPLRRLTEQGVVMEKSTVRVPTWFINATSSQSRSAFGWARAGQRDFTQFTLQISPFGARSGFYGAIPDFDGELDLLDAVVASAAFFDPNENAVEQRMLLGFFQHFSTLDWGTDIPNPTVWARWRRLHTLMPFPLYYIDGTLRQLSEHKPWQHSGYIRLLDGGNNDNLGAYTLIEAGMNHIFISDHSGDRQGKMKDMCLLLNEVALRSAGKTELVMPGLAGFKEYCRPYLAESKPIVEEGQEGAPGSEGKPAAQTTAPLAQAAVEPEKYYPITGWTYPVLLGCVRPVGGTATACDGPGEKRLYVLKPALDLEKFKADHLRLGADGETYTVRPEACSASQPGICEVAAYIAERLNHTGEIGAFPQHATATTTWASTGKIYGAYRELARWHMREALKFLDPKAYAQEWRRQENEPLLTITPN